MQLLQYSVAVSDMLQKTVTVVLWESCRKQAILLMLLVRELAMPSNTGHFLFCSCPNLYLGFAVDNTEIGLCSPLAKSLDQIVPVVGTCSVLVLYSSVSSYVVATSLAKEETVVKKLGYMGRLPHLLAFARGKGSYVGWLDLARSRCWQLAFHPTPLLLGLKKGTPYTQQQK